MTTDTVPVTVIIPIYRAKKTIRRAIESVANQTAPPAELIVVDDHSEDGTLEYLRSLAEILPQHWMRVVSSESNGGPGVARNIGWELASQPFIAFLDADDAWYLQKLQIQHDFMSSNPEFAITGHGTEQVTGFSLGDPGQEARGADRDFQEIRFLDQLLSNRFSTRTVMIRRDIPFRFEHGKRRAEDYLLWTQIIRHGMRGCVLDHVLSCSFKGDFGEGGLTGDSVKMMAGIVDSYRILVERGLVPRIYLPVLVAWAYLKLIRRLIVLSIRRLLRKHRHLMR